MPGLTPELVNIQKAKEKELVDTWIDTKGVVVTIKPVKLYDDDNDPVQHDVDPFGIDVNKVGYDEGTIKYGELYTRKAIFVNEAYQFMSISHDIMLEDFNGENESSNFGEVYCFISGVIVPKYSILTFDDFPGIFMRINEIEKKKPISDVHRYKLVRC